MRNYLTSTTECSIYPGSYLPVPEIEAVKNGLKTPGKGSSARLPVNMNEGQDCFKIIVAVPVSKREDIFVNVSNEVLSIVAFHMNYNEAGREKIQIHEFDEECLERQIKLPKNADTEFVSAEFSKGILRLHIPKTNGPVKSNNGNIVVY